jgi:hypothetical protein
MHTAPPAARPSPAPPTPPATARRACYGVLRFVMEQGAKGCEVIVSGKLRAARAKSMKFKDGYMVSSGHPKNVYVDGAVRHVLLRQGVLGIKVRRWCHAAAVAAAERLPGSLTAPGAAPSDAGAGAEQPRQQPATPTNHHHHTTPHPQVKIMKDFDPTGRNGPRMPLPDVVKVHEPKDDELVADKPFVGKEMEA